MRKKLLALFIILSLNTPYASARVGTPSFDFEIAENPAAQDTGSKDNGLSGGAVTAITLGSIGGAGLLGLGAFLLRRQAEKNLTAGTVIGARKPICPICLDKNPNAQIYERINKRVDMMIENGLIEETKQLLNKHGRINNLLYTIGYQEIISYLDGEMTLDEASALLKQNSRRYAKRQLTWFRKNENIKWNHYPERLS